MEYNKQWGSSEKRHKKCHKKFETYHRAALKNRNWKTSEEANAILREYNCWKPDYGYCKRYNINLEEKLLLKFIGKPFKEFEIEWHKHTKMLRHQGVECQLYCINPAGSSNPEDWKYKWYYSFLVDDDGIIQKNPIHPKWKSEKKAIKIIEKEVVIYKLRTDIYNVERGMWYITKHHPVLRILRQYFSREQFRLILDGLNETQFRKFCDLSYMNGCHRTLYGYCQKYNKNLPRFGGYGYCNYNDFQSLFHKDNSKSVYKYINPGTPEYTKYFAEREKARNKERREDKLYKENYNTTLLHNIETKRKFEEGRINDETIERHGFDKYESFRGEKYHGGHKKKKS